MTFFVIKKAQAKANAQAQATGLVFLHLLCISYFCRKNYYFCRNNKSKSKSKSKCNSQNNNNRAIVATEAIEARDAQVKINATVTLRILSFDLK